MDNRLDPDQLHVTREALRSGGLLATCLPPGEVRDPILRSWRRCVSAEIPAERLRTCRVERANTPNLLARAATPVLDWLRDELSDLGVAVILCNRSGRIISRRVADARQRDRLDDHYVLEGFDYSEQTVGTNGLGTALEEKKAVWVHGAEHFNDALAVFACVGVPILSPRGDTVAGSLSLAAAASASNPMMMSLTKLAARQVEQQLHELVYAREATLASAFAQRSRGHDGPTMLLTDDSVLIDTALLPLMTPANHVALWEAVQRQSWQTATASFGVGVGVGVDETFVEVEARRIEDADGPAYLLRFPSRDGLRHKRMTAATIEDRSRPGQVVHLAHVSPVVHRRVLAAAHTADLLAISGPPGSGRLHAATQLALETNRATLVLDSVMLAGTPVRDWLASAARAVADGSCVIVRHAESLPPESFAGIESIVSDQARTGSPRGLFVMTVDRQAASPPVADLLDRLAVTVEVPALAELGEHLPALAQDLLESIGEGRPLRLSSSALQALMRWHWPGNIRELRTVLLAAAAATQGPLIQPDALPLRLTSSYRSASLSGIERAERSAIVEALSRSQGNRSRAADELGIGRTTLYRKMRELKVTNAGARLE